MSRPMPRPTSRPTSEGAYLAGLTPASVAGTRIGRRSLLKGTLAGAGLLGGRRPARGVRLGRLEPGRRGQRERGIDLRLEPVRPSAEEGLRGAGGGLQQPRLSRSARTRSTTTPSRRTSPTTCRASPTTCSRGSPGTACGSSPSRASSGDVSDVWSSIITGASEALKQQATGEGRQAVLHPVRLLPLGRLLPAQPVRRARLHPRRRRSTSSSRWPPGCARTG